VRGDGDSLGVETAIFVANMIAMTGSGYMRLFPSSQVMDETFLSAPEACRHLFVIGGQARTWVQPSNSRGGSHRHIIRVCGALYVEW